MAANEESDPSAILNGFWVTHDIVLSPEIKIFNFSSAPRGGVRCTPCIVLSAWAVRDNADSFNPPKRFRVVWIPSVAASEQATLMEMDYATVAATYGIEE